MKIKDLHQLFLTSNSICTDTRKLKKNDFFFGIKGEHFDGNAFANEAIKKGASYAIVDNPSYSSSKTILVKNSLSILQQLANYHRKYLNIKIIALTGSNGKTTTKELIHTVLKKKYKVSATRGNLNNHIGVPLTLLSMNKNTEIGIVEMGANHIKEIEFLCDITEPDFGYITNFGKAHLEGFGSLEGVIQGKSELYKYLIKNNRLIFLNANNKQQIKLLKGYKNTYSFGNNDNTDCIVHFLDANPFVSLKIKKTIINSRLIGKYNFGNIAVACAIGHYFKVPLNHIKNAIEHYMPQNNRSQIIKKKSTTIILDAYNANPTSMKAALDNLLNIKDKHKIAILGDMFELGKDTAKEHEIMVKFVTTLGFDHVYFIGNHFYKTKTQSYNISKFKDLKTMETLFKTQNLNNTTLLIKGSRGMALEHVLDILKQ